MEQRLQNLKNYFLNYFEYNLISNQMLLRAMDRLPDPKEALELFKELIDSHRQWLRCMKTNGWSKETLKIQGLAALQTQWRGAIDDWCSFISSTELNDLQSPMLVVCLKDGDAKLVTVRDIAFQLNSMSLYVREQIVRIFRVQNCEPPHTDHVFSALRTSAAEVNA